MINWKVRLKNPVVVAQLLLAIGLPILSYYGMTPQDLTEWGTLGGLVWAAVCNPYVLGLIVVSVWNCLNDPTTKGLGDSGRAMTYTAPAE